MTPYYDCDGITIYHGDCREVLPTLPKFDLLLTDPPYGIDFTGSNASTRDWDGINGDKDTSLAKWLMENLQIANEAIIFGANCFPELLPHRGRWICWDKRLSEQADKMLGSAFELAWVNKTSGFDRMFRKLHGGVVNADGGRRVHPTQKPSGLFREIMNTMAPDAKTILDPFMGSGTTLVAAKREGRQATGIELEERYCEAAVKRLQQGVFDFDS